MFLSRMVMSISNSCTLKDRLHFWSSKADVCQIPDKNVACEENPPVGQDVTSQLSPSTCSKYGVGSILNEKQYLTWSEPLL